MSDELKVVHDYVHAIEKELIAGNATEHTHRPALKTLVETLASGTTATNEPSRIACGAPDFVITKGALTVGYIEAKDVGKSLDEAEKSEQLERYLGSLSNLILTDYLEFRWYVDGSRRLSASLGYATKDGKIKRDVAGTEAVTELLDSFLAHKAEAVGTPKDLAIRMARLAHMMKDLIVNTFNSEPGAGSLHGQLAAFRNSLVPELSIEQFGDMYAQTIAYGLFAALCTAKEGSSFSRKDAAYMLPKTNPFLRKLFYHIAGPDLDERIAWLVDDLAQVLAQADMEAVLKDFGKQTAKEDPVVHFYETFLKEYDPDVREVRGVYYTPEPVVSYIVRSVDHLLKDRFAKMDGLADQETLILDPAVGTATFLYMVINQIYQTLKDKGQQGLWNTYVPDKLLPRIFGFELLMAPYAVAHLKLGLLLQETGYHFSSEHRLGIYLTNTLEEAFKKAELLTGFNEYIVAEADAAGEIKRDKPIMVVLGNPPYSKKPANKGKWIDGLLKGRLPDGQVVGSYYDVDGAPLGERNPKWLQNDYVKFIRFGQWRIQNTGQGVLAFITGHGYLSNPTFRGMRQQLLQAFNEIYILDLHGNTNKGEQNPAGGKDENVFDIKEGVVIGVFIKHAGKAGPAIVYHSDVWGMREHKYKLLAQESIQTTSWTALSPKSPSYLFVPREIDLQSEYDQFWKVTDIFFVVYASTVTTARNDFAMATSADVLKDRIGDLRDKSMDDETVRSKYKLSDVSYWKLSDARKQLQTVDSIDQYIRPYCYRRFDFRFVFYQKAICERLRSEVMRHVNSDNLCFLTHRPYSPGAFTFAYCTRMIGDQCVAANKSAGGGNSYQFPLYIYLLNDDQSCGQEQLFAVGAWPVSQKGRVPNLTPQFVSTVGSKVNWHFVTEGAGDLETTFGPDDIFFYIYATVHAPAFRARYAEFLKDGFARIPITSNKGLFKALVAKGHELVSVHLMESPKLNALVTKYPVSGSNMVEAVKYDEQDMRVFINKNQFVEGVSPDIWSFVIGGYQVADKWLKDRKGKALTYDEVTHYQKVVVAIRETIRIMAEIDNDIDACGGWPGTFS
ncbi:MAG: N-6 DNA methylase [Chloroflexi bacterium]|nr:N-6 DNA methylase [Chloroflexota bacterium]